MIRLFTCILGYFSLTQVLLKTNYLLEIRQITHVLHDNEYSVCYDPRYSFPIDNPQLLKH